MRNTYSPPGTPVAQSTPGNVLPENASRLSWCVQNLGTNPLFIRLGPNASTTVFHLILKAGTAANDGTGGIVNDTVHQGIVSVAGTSPSYVAWEVSP